MSPRLGAALIAAALCAACTLLVENELSSHHDAGCGEQVFFDGRQGGGGALYHTGVTQLAWHGPAFPILTRDPNNFGATVAFLSDGGLLTAGGGQEGVFLRDESFVRPTAAWPMAGHEGNDGFGCSESLAATYDPLHDRTAWQVVPGGCGDDANFYDGGVTSGAPAAQGAAIGWGPGADAGTFAALLGGQAQACDEVFPLSCFPPQGTALPPGGARVVDGLAGAGGKVVWAVTTFPASGDGEVRLYSEQFAALDGGPAVPWAGAVTPLDADVAMAARISGGNLQAVLFDSSGAQRAAQSSIPLGDSGAHGLLIARFGGAGTQVRAAWVGGDGQARTATLDATAPAAITLSAPAVVCGSAGATLAAPMNPSLTLVQVGEALYLRSQ